MKPSALRNLGAGARLALSAPRVLLCLWAVQFLFALVVAVPVHGSALEHLAPVAGFVEDQANAGLRLLPAWLFEDWARTDPGGLAAAGAVVAPLMLLASLFGVLLASGWMHLALDPKPSHGLRRFFAGAGEHFFPFLRLWVMALALYAFATWLLWGSPGGALQDWLLNDRPPAAAADERWGRGVEIGFSLVYALLLLQIEVVVDLARASLVAAKRQSAVSALLRAMAFWLRHGWSALKLVGSGLLLEGLWIGLLVSMTGWAGLPLWGLALLLPWGRIALRGARWSGLALLYHQWTHPAPAQKSRPLDEGTVWAEDSAA